MAYTTYTFTLTGGAANTKGSYTQIVAATPYASSRLHLTLEFGGAAQRFFLIDLATGAAGLESVVVANLACDADSDQISGNFVSLDVDIPAGTRLAARCQSGTASATIAPYLLLEDRALGGLAPPATYGIDAAFSRGTVIDPGAVASTKSAYVQFAAATAARIDALLLCFTVKLQGNAITVAGRWLVDVATGAAAAETIVIPDVVAAGNTVADGVRPGIRRLPVSIPAGSRLAVRVSCSHGTVNQRELAVTLIGMQEPATGGGAAGAVAYVG